MLRSLQDEPMIVREHEPQELIVRGDVIVRAQTINEDERTVEAVLATETRAVVFDMRKWRQVEEILLIDGCDIPQQIPLLDSHPQLRGYLTIEDMRGSIRSMRIERRQLVGRLYFATDEKSERAWQLVRAGHVSDISTGNIPLEQVEIAPGTSQVVRGRKYTAHELPLLVTVRWRPREGSLVPVGADQKSKIRSETSTVPPKLRSYLESLGLNREATEAEAWAFHATLRGDQLAHAETLRGDATPPAPATPPSTPPAMPAPAPAQQPQQIPAHQPAPVPPTLDPAALRAEGANMELARIRRIQELAGSDVPADIVRQAIEERWDEGRASREFLAIVRGRRNPPVPGVPGAPAIHPRSHETDCTRASLEAAMLIRAGLDPVQHYVRYEEGAAVRTSATERPQLEQAADRAWRYRDLSMIDLCREAIRLDGGNLPHSRGEIIRTAMSGSSLSAIFTTTVGAQLLAAYEAAPDTTVGWVRVAEVPNFQTNERTQMGKSSRLKKLPRGQKATQTEVSAKKEEYKIARYANQFVVDEQDFMDDNFGGLQDMPAEMGEAARQLGPDLVYAILLANAPLMADNVDLFHVDHGNLRSSSALAGPTLKTAITDMSTQTDNGRALGISPYALLVPKALKHTASELINSSEIRDTTVSKERGTRNALLDDNLTLISDSRLDNGVIDPATETVHAGSSTTWFLVARAGRHTIEIGYRRGTGRAPQLRSFVLTQGQWGMGWDINLDIGAKALDFRGLHKSTQ